jgi:1-acyl-sn-glycerol-3-phosphate acyltransferase
MVNVFPEGNAFPDGVMRELKTGAVRLVKETAQRTGREAYIVPTYIRYGRYAPAWLAKQPDALRYGLMLLSPWYFRRGVTVVFGKPIAASELPDDIHEATLVLRQRILALDPARNG